MLPRHKGTKKFTQVVPSLRGLQTRAIPANVFGGSSNRRPRTRNATTAFASHEENWFVFSRSHHPPLTPTMKWLYADFCTRTTIMVVNAILAKKNTETP